MPDSEEAQRACENCGSIEHLQEGLCQQCRRVVGHKVETPETDRKEHPYQAPVIPIHRPPWRRRGA